MSKIKWEQIRHEWETSNVTFKALAEKHGLKDSTVRSRKNREKWQRNDTGNATKEHKNVATKKVQPRKSKRVEKEPVIENDDLTDKQKLFCIYYLKYFNATKAYQKAYDCAYTTAMVNGHKLLRNTNISDEIDRLKEEQATELKLDIREILQKYIDIAFADITDFVEFGQRPGPEDLLGFDDDGAPIYDETARTYNFFNLKDSTEIDGTILTEVKEGKEGITVKLADKMKALEVLTKYFDLLSDKDQKQLQQEKLKAETDHIQERTKLLKGEQKDTSMLEALLDGQKQFEEMAKSGNFDGFEKSDPND